MSGEGIYCRTFTMKLLFEIFEGSGSGQTELLAHPSVRNISERAPGIEVPLAEANHYDPLIYVLTSWMDWQDQNRKQYKQIENLRDPRPRGEH